MQQPAQQHQKVWKTTEDWAEEHDESIFFIYLFFCMVKKNNFTTFKQSQGGRHNKVYNHRKLSLL